MKYFALALMIVFAVWVNGNCQDSGESYDNSDTGYQSSNNSRDGSAAIDTNKTYYSKYDLSDFRKTHWGMTKDEVRQAETATPNYDRQNAADQSGYGGLYFTGDYAGLKADIEYTFVGDSLAAAEYVFEGPDNEDYINQFEDIKAIVDSDYWPADYDDAEIVDQSYLDDPESWQAAIADGDEERQAEWDTNRSTITLDMWGNSGTITLELLYKPVD